MNSEPQQHQLYEFVASDPDGSRTRVGWWDGRRWVACFGEGMWSSDVVSAYRAVAVESGSADGAHSNWSIWRRVRARLARHPDHGWRSSQPAAPRHRRTESDQVA